ncbi:MAG: hypothetical protein HYV78_00100 [Candidatus Wildermuthbacteria bacterium]|nr:hypothetical protein [Candidatus Wildermuthbacteria bacterium]
MNSNEKKLFEGNPQTHLLGVPPFAGQMRRGLSELAAGASERRSKSFLEWYKATMKRNSLNSKPACGKLLLL